MKKIISIFIVFLVILCSHGFSQSTLSSSYGYSITPADTLRVLVVFVEKDFSCCTTSTCQSLSNPTWPEGQLPINVDDYFDPYFYPSGPQAYMTKYFYEMSNGKFIVLGDYIDHVITIPCSDMVGASTYVTDQLKQYILDYEADPINNPIPLKNYSNPYVLDEWNIAAGSAFSKAYSPKLKTRNYKFDMVISIKRNFEFGDDGNGPKFTGGAIVPGLHISKTMGSFTGFDNFGDFKCADGSFECQQFVLQEFFHALYGGNSWHTGWGAGKHTFMNKTNAWGISMQLAGVGISNSINGYDRDRLGWKGWLDNSKTVRKTELISALDQSHFEIKTDFDINSDLGNGLFVLRDFVNYGDAIRIKLPHLKDDTLNYKKAKNQFLWIENHQLISDFDHGNYEFLSCKDPISKGMYSYIQVGKTIKDTNVLSVISTEGSPQIENGAASWIFPLSAEGNFDFFYRDKLNGGWVCGSNGFNFANIDKTNPQHKPNPLTGYSDLYNFYNSNNNSKLEHDASDKFQPIGGEYLGGTALTFSMFDRGDSEDAFGSGSSNFKISNSTNPPSTPVYTYTSNEALKGPTFDTAQHRENYENRAIWLNGISIDLLQENYNPSLFGNGAILVKVRFDDYDIENDVRWCGNIKVSPHNFDTTLNDFSDSLFCIKLKKAKTISLDRGRSYTRDYKVEFDVPSNEYLFTEPTVFTLLSNSSILLEKYSSVIVAEKSTFRVKNNSLTVLDANSSIIVKKDSKLVIENGAHLILKDGAFIKIEKGGTLEYDNSNIELLGDNSYIEFEGNLQIDANAEFTFTGLGYIKFSETGWINPATNPSNIIAGTNSKIKLVGTGIDDKVLEITQETMYAHFPLVKFTLQNGKAELGDNARLSVDKDLTMDNAKITSIPFGPHNHRGLTIFGQPNINVSYSTFENGKFGMYAISTYGGSPLLLKNCRFQNNEWGLTTVDKGVTLQSCVFINNSQQGWNAVGMTFPSYVGGGLFKQNNNGGTFLATGTSPLIINKGNIQLNTVNGFEFNGPAMITFTCGLVNNNGLSSSTGAGALVKNSAFLNNSPYIAPYGGKSNFSGNKNAVHAICSNYWYILGGRNNFTSVNKCAFGTMNISCTSPSVVGLMNQWKTAITGPISGTDYSLTTCSCLPNISVGLSDANPKTAISCLTSWSPTPVEKNAIANANPIEKCPGCEKILTTSYNKVKLNDAIKDALSYISNVDSLNTDAVNNNITAIDRLNQILTFQFRKLSTNKHLTGDEIWLLELAYEKIKETLGKAIQRGQTGANLSSTEVIKVIQANSSLRLLVDFLSSHDKLLYLSLDKAGIYKLINERGLALQELDNLRGCPTHDPVQDEYISTLRNDIFTEMQILNGTIPKENFEKVFSQLQNGTSVLSDGIYLNPTNDSTIAENVKFVGDTINFNLNSTGNSDFWNFGDCSTSIDAKPVHIYAAPANYNAAVKRDYNCISNFDTVQIILLPKPDVSVDQVKIQSTCEYLTTKLNKHFIMNNSLACLSNSSSAINSSKIRFKCYWDFSTPYKTDLLEYFSFDSVVHDLDSSITIVQYKGEHTRYKLKTTVQYYQNAEWINVGHEIIFEDSLFNEDYFSGTIAMDSSTCQNDTINFISTVLGGSAPYHYDWKIDHNNFSGPPEINYVFPNPGTYQVELSITDSKGCKANIEFPQGIPVEGFGFPDSGIVLNNNLGFEIEIDTCPTIFGYAYVSTTCCILPVPAIMIGLVDTDKNVAPQAPITVSDGYFTFSPSVVEALDHSKTYRFVVLNNFDYVNQDKNFYSLDDLVNASPINLLLTSTQQRETFNTSSLATDPVFTSFTDTVNNSVSINSVVNSSTDFYVKKSDVSGNILWENTYDGYAGGCDSTKAMCVDASGNIYVTGNAWNGTDKDMLTIKYDANGNILWSKSYSDTILSNETPHSICIDSLGQICVHGIVRKSSSHSFVTVKYANCNPVGDPIIRTSTPPEEKPKTKPEEKISVSIFPNPNRDGILNIRSNISASSITIIITDITGKTVITQNLNSGNGTIQLPDKIISGVYCVFLKDNTSNTIVSQQKLILM